MKSIEGKQVLVTGGGGSIGSQLVRALLSHQPDTIRVLDNNEGALFQMQSEYAEHSGTIRYLLGDVRDRDRIQLAMEGIDIVFHCAALKHVGLNEYNPFETVRTNVQGTQNVVRAAIEAEVDSFVGISTDKASNPTSVMGATKLLSERLIIGADAYKGSRETSFNCVRFGNVVGSRGSVVPVFLRQIERGGPITVTDPEMTRFLIAVERAIELVFWAHERLESGELSVLKMPAFRLEELVDAMRNEYAPYYGYSPSDIEIEIIGPKPGERTHEKLISTDEMNYAHEQEDMFVLRPHVDVEDFDESVPEINSLNGEYTSAEGEFLTEEELITQIESTNLISTPKDTEADD